MQQDIYEKSCRLIVSPLSDDMLACIDQQIGSGGFPPARGYALHGGRLPPYRGQARVPGGDKEGDPPPTRELVDERTRSARLLAERFRGDGEVNHRPKFRRDGFRGWEAWGQLLLLAEFQ